VTIIKSAGKLTAILEYFPLQSVSFFEFITVLYKVIIGLLE